MVVIHEIAQTIWLTTPKGMGYARFLIDRGDDADLQWVVFMCEGSFSGEIWTFSNWDVRLARNDTMNRDSQGWTPTGKPRRDR